MRPRVSILNRLPPVPQQFAPVPLRGPMRLFQCYPGNDVVSKSLYWLGEFDPWVNWALRRLTRRSDTVVDIGANIGATTLCLAECVGPKGRVIAFEPFPPHLEKLRANVQGNGLATVTIEPLALSTEPGSLTMSMPDVSHQGMARVGGGGERVAAVPSDTFDRVARRLQLRSINVCKIDVEGHEPQVLAGMKETLASRIIQAFVFEHHRKPGETEKDQVMGLLEEQGYRVMRLYKRFMSVEGVPVGQTGAGEATADHVAILPASEAERRWQAEEIR
ncbi:MAG TPA: FkbM family methyltransferase [Tepidisphaeraceae bacterium]|nr:FkbM family methyltransferase [Tepidisphaeraceae bacterium]